MKRLFALLTLCIVFGRLAVAQQTQQDSLQNSKIVLDEVLVSGVRVDAQAPVTHSNLSKTEIAKRNLGQDIPVLMNYLPSVVTTSDAGNGVGYTGIRVRGSDATRVNITINGIPYNDSESMGTFWVNMPDFASSTESMQLQRGVGTSTNGAGAFGASLNLLTDAFSEEAFGEISVSTGSFNTQKYTAKFSTGLLNDHFELAGRLSRITSEGFIDRASSDLDSYFLQGTYVDDNTLIKALVFGGHEITYQSWYGFDAGSLGAIGIDTDIESNTTYNIAGIQFNENGIFEGYYENQVDNYKQDHFQLHWNEKLSEKWSTNLAFHYTRGRGFYEEYVDDWLYANIYFSSDSQLSFIGRDSFTLNGEDITSTDYIRRRWLDNDFYGTVFSVNYTNEKLNFIVGGGYNHYEGDHFGEVLWAEFTDGSDYEERYYDNSATKTDFNMYAKADYKIDNQWTIFADLQYRRVGYEAAPEDVGPVDDVFNFFNPKAGITLDVNESNNLYFSYARANREPNRSNYENGANKPERLDDLELGWRYNTSNIVLNTNLYYMKYKDQLALTGAIDDVGAPIAENIGDSYRLGLEVDALIQVSDKWTVRPNAAISINKNQDYYFAVDGILQDLGNTNIAFSPEVILGNIISFNPVDNLNLSFYTKYVGEQYMGNIDWEASKLDSYLVNDLSLQYQIQTNSIFESIVITGMVNNIFDEFYISNGYFGTWDDDFSVPGEVTTYSYSGFYPQAGINGLVGVTFNF